jgi:electron-transferring-flavoprotein dehydrogenase
LYLLRVTLKNRDLRTLKDRKAEVMSEITREEMEIDVLLVGAGPANLSCAYHLMQLIEKDTAGGGNLSETVIMVIEKGAHVGAHSISGAVLDPIALKEMIPNYQELNAPVKTAVSSESMLYLTRRGKFKMPWVPASMHHHGCYIISLSELVTWLGAQLEAKGCEIFAGTGGAKLLLDGDRVIGVQTDDKGINKEGEQKPSFEPGMNLKAKVTVLGEGVRGSLTKVLSKQLNLDRDRNPQNYTTGVKELWEFPAGSLKPGLVYHTMGYPLDNETFGGGFVYNLSDTLMAIGLVVGLNYRNPYEEPQALFSQMKTHPFVAKLLEKGKMIRYGAKAVPEGGYWSVPKNHGNGFLITGDATAFLNPARLKGIHLAMKSGMLAAETIFESLKKNDQSEAALSLYDQKWRSSFIYRELYGQKNFHFMFERGVWSAPKFVATQLFRGLGSRPHGVEDRLSMRKVADYFGSKRPQPEEWRPKSDSKTVFSKLDSVYYSGTNHDEDQPSHLQVSDTDICATKCVEEYGNPCQYFCPAQVYEMEEVAGGRRLKINASNCVHCKTCDIADPYGIITWVTPEGGGGPKYDGL